MITTRSELNWNTSKLIWSNAMYASSYFWKSSNPLTHKLCRRSLVTMFEEEIGKLLGIIPPASKKRKTPLEETGQFFLDVASTATTVATICYVGNWLLKACKK